MKSDKSSIVSVIPFLVLSGGVLLLHFGWSTLSGGTLTGLRWWTAVLGTMFGPPDGTMSIALLAVFVFCIYLCFRNPEVQRSTRRTIVWISLSRLAGTLLAQALLLPGAIAVAWIANYV